MVTASLTGLVLGLSGNAIVAEPVNAQSAIAHSQHAHSQHNRTIVASGEQQFFTDVERRILQGILDEVSPSETGNGHHDHQGRGAQSRGGPPGRSGGLPPGIAMNLERGKALPPGIAKRYPPSSVQRQLPERTDHEIVIINDDAYLIGRATGVIVDILLGNR